MYDDCVAVIFTSVDFKSGLIKNRSKNFFMKDIKSLFFFLNDICMRRKKQRVHNKISHEFPLHFADFVHIQTHSYSLNHSLSTFPVHIFACLF